MSTIFISYSRHDKELVRVLIDDVGTIGHEVWFDEDLSGGQAWWDQILAQIRRCDVFVIALSPAALSSAACQSEHSYAAALRKPILPVVVADGVSVTLLPPTLSQVQLVSYRNQNRTEALRLARAIASMPATPPLPDPLPLQPEVPTSYLGHLAEKVDSTHMLTYDEQSALLVDLRRAMQDPSTREDSRTLLTRLRRRRDLFAAIAEEIDGPGVRVATPPLPHVADAPTGGHSVSSSSYIESPTAPGAHNGPNRGVLVLTGPLGWLYALRREPGGIAKLALGTALIFFFALMCFANGDGIDGYDDDIWEYIGFALVAASWTWPFAFHDLKSRVFTGRSSEAALS